MEITQKDRDLLRQAQYKTKSSKPFQIGNIVEHKIEDPSKYKSRSRQEQGLAADARPNLPKLNYQSVYLKDANQKQAQTTKKELISLAQNGKNISQDSQARDKLDELQLDLPIAPGDVQANLWLNMDRIEFEKLEWMSSIADKNYLEKLRTSVHFDCEGKAIPAPESEKDAPQNVHDIDTLVKLLDSSFQPQVTYALNVLSKIATRATLGLYDALFDDNIHQVILKECLLRVRHHIDSSNETICQCALKCLRSLICNTQIDEIFLDKLSPIKTEKIDPVMWLCSSQEDFDIDMKDNDCLYKDAILGLIVRTDLLTRFKYLLSARIDPKFSLTYYDCILDLLVRIARYSQDICWILHNNGFPKMVIDIFLPADIVTRDHTQQSLALRALKFLRIITEAAKELKHYNHGIPGGPVIKLPQSIIEVIETYYHIDVGTRDPTDSDRNVLFRIKIETLRLMHSLATIHELCRHITSTLALDQKGLVEQVRSLAHLNVLKPIEAPSSLDWQFVAALLSVLRHVTRTDRLLPENQCIHTLWTNFIRPQTIQWFNEIITDRFIPHQDVSIALYVAAKIFIEDGDETALEDFYAVLFRCTRRILPRDDLGLKYFKYLLREATNGSQLGSFLDTDGRRRDPVMLRSYGFMNFNTSIQHSYKLNGVIGRDSPYILLNLYLTISQSYPNHNASLAPYYVDNDDLVRYLRTTSVYHKYPNTYESEVQRSIPAQLEVHILAVANLLLCSYYLSPSDDQLRSVSKSSNPNRTRSECYSQLVVDVYSIIGLMNPEIEHMLSLKDILLEEAILVEGFISRLSSESRSTERHLDFSTEARDSIYRDLSYYKLNGREYGALGLVETPLDDFDITIMKAIYLSLEQPGRYWIFQPIVEYYRCQICNQDDSKRIKDGKWFAQNINKSKNGNILPVDCLDASVIYRVLKLNALLMHRSAAYLEMIIKQNIEEFLCLIGSVFLDDDLFLDENVNRALCHNLELILTFCLQNGIYNVFGDASFQISTLDLPLIDFFNRLVDQHEAASYNDVVFTNFLLLFLTSSCDRIFRKKLFSDKLDTCLSQMSISPSEVWTPIDLLCKDQERDPEIRNLIKNAGPRLNRSPFLSYYRRHHLSGLNE